MYWVEGPRWWQTNQPLPAQESMGGFCWNEANLPDCLRNFTRSAVALRRVIDKYEAEGRTVPAPYSLDAVLKAYRNDLDPIARHVLEERDRQRGLVETPAEAAPPTVKG